MNNFLRHTLVAEFERLKNRSLETVREMSRAQLLWRPAGSDANPVGFLLWHVGRSEEDHPLTRIGGEQLWKTEGWHQRFGIDPEADGFGFTPEQVRNFPMPALEDIIAYYSRVRDRTLEYLRGSSDSALRGPMPGMPETPIFVYLLSRLGHEHVHWGQMDYLKGIMPFQ